MNTKTMCAAYGVEELSPEQAMTTEGGLGPILVGSIVGLVLYMANNAGEFVKGVVDGWNAYQS